MFWMYVIACVHLVHFSSFGIMYQDKSGNPASVLLNLEQKSLNQTTSCKALDRCNGLVNIFAKKFWKKFGVFLY
jgi:hypothetical protein